MILFLLFIMITNNAIAQEERFFDTHGRGWYWYEEEKLQKEKEKLSVSAQGASLKMKALKAQLERTLDQAVLYPSEKNIISYILLQEKIADKSERFANNWQKVLYTHPELDRKIKHPTTQAALPIYYQQKSKTTQTKVASLAKEYGLLYFYKGSCPYCTAFSSVVKDFAARYNLAVLGVSLDGMVAQEFPDSKTDNGIATSLNVKVVPALIAVHPKTGKQIPIAYGFISQSEMEARINLLVEGEQ
jgi:conjugal transfer pilus assembly protein TraF